MRSTMPLHSLMVVHRTGVRGSQGRYPARVQLSPLGLSALVCALSCPTGVQRIVLSNNCRMGLAKFPSKTSSCATTQLVYVVASATYKSSWGCNHARTALWFCFFESFSLGLVDTTASFTCSSERCSIPVCRLGSRRPKACCANSSTTGTRSVPMPEEMCAIAGVLCG